MCCAPTHQQGEILGGKPLWYSLSELHFGHCALRGDIFRSVAVATQSRNCLKLFFQKRHTIVVDVVSERQTKKERKRGASAQMWQSFPSRTAVKRGSFHSSACQPRRRQTRRANCEATEGRKTSANSSDSSRRCQLATPDTSITTVINQQAANGLYLPQQSGKSAGHLTGGVGRGGSFHCETVKSSLSHWLLDAASVSFRLSTSQGS